jgi:hypothetical protein
MKANLLRKYILPGAVIGLVSGLTLTCSAGPGIIISVPAPPTVVISAPAPPSVVVAPAPTVAVVPDDYVWDGTEYVGVVGGQYYYLGPGGAWVVCDPVRFHRFQGYISIHPDWRGHMTHNVNYRGNYGHDYGHDHPQPMHDQPAHDQSSHGDYNRPGHNGPPQ